MKKIGSLLVKIALLSFVLVAVAPVATPVVSGDAYAADAAPAETNNNALTTVMCRALKVVTGSAGKAFAAFAIISVGIGFFTGKVSWGLMIGVAAGIAAMFGAPTIVKAISGDSVTDNCDTYANNSTATDN